MISMVLVMVLTVLGAKYYMKLSATLYCEIQWKPPLEFLQVTSWILHISFCPGLLLGNINLLIIFVPEAIWIH